MDATAPNHFADSAETQRLLMQISAGHRTAFDDLFNRHRGELRQAVELRLDRRLRARVDASDIVQEAQMEAFRRLDDYLQRRPMPFSLWLRKTAQERIYNHRRAHVATARRSILREQPIPEESSMLIANSLMGHGSSPSRHVIRREYQRLVSEAVNELDDVDREILLMRNVEGLAQSEIAQVLDLTHDAVRKRYGRALVKLQRSLAKKGLAEGEPD
jgi:RNA polymerase sigma-70 factor (ECF subfamily)